LKPDSRLARNIIVPSNKPARLADIKNLYEFVLRLDDKSIILPECKILPDEFQSFEEYIKSFEPLILLECHSSFMNALNEDVGKQNFVTILDTIKAVDNDHGIFY
jgi:hypothetical protein